MSANPQQLLAAVTDIARRAGREILDVYSGSEILATAKEDASPLTLADLRAHRLIEDALQQLTPAIPVLSEEASELPFTERGGWARYWLVDPLDGTKEFLSRNGQFTVNIALIDAHAPVLGVVHVPVRDTTYQGLPGEGAWRESATETTCPIHVRRECSNPVRVVGSRSHRGDSLDAFLARLGPYELVPVGSSLKFCMVAEGSADVYPRLGPTSEWDTAAAHAVVLGAGGDVHTLEGGPLRYNTRASLLNPFFVAYGPRDRDWQALLG